MPQEILHPYFYQDPWTLVELKIIHFISSVLNKRNWAQKLADPVIKSKWEQEAIGMDPKMLEYCFKELEAVKDSKDGFEVLPNARIQDDLVPDSLKQDLKHFVKKLEEKPKDWHPGSTVVLDLVHPSLYCVIFDQTRYKDGDVLKVVAKPNYGLQERLGQDQFQWLPAEFRINEKVHIDSYINNLNPKEFKRLYTIFESIFERVLPMLENVLGRLASKEYKRIKYEFEPFDSPEYEPDGTADYDERYDQIWEENRVPNPPVIPESYEKPVIDTPIVLKDRNVQVIVKMANIHLTPENNRYDGGVWHVEGTDSERIVATVIYYYDSENISTSKLSFRAVVDAPDYDQGDHRGVNTIYGLVDEEASSQILGSVECIQDRIVVFPNVYQHKVEPFELVDGTKPGHRKILVFFIVNPTIQVLSSAQVPFQQKEWGAEELHDVFKNKLPSELTDQIAGQNQYWMDLKQAKKVREDLMESRRAIGGGVDAIFEEEFSLCEH
jgi:hypothetical protein